jgi:hypothetical protein
MAQVDRGDLIHPSARYSCDLLPLLVRQIFADIRPQLASEEYPGRQPKLRCPARAGIDRVEYIRPAASTSAMNATLPLRA